MIFGEKFPLGLTGFRDISRDCLPIGVNSLNYRLASLNFSASITKLSLLITTVNNPRKSHIGGRSLYYHLTEDQYVDKISLASSISCSQRYAQLDQTFTYPSFKRHDFLEGKFIFSHSKTFWVNIIRLYKALDSTYG
jgi:hypothetical protein